MGKRSSAYEKLKKIHVEVCRNCEEKHGKKDIDDCFKCETHKLLNEIYNELNGK